MARLTTLNVRSDYVWAVGFGDWDSGIEQVLIANVEPESTSMNTDASAVMDRLIPVP